MELSRSALERFSGIESISRRLPKAWHGLNGLNDLNFFSIVCRCWKDQRLDHDRHRSRCGNQSADINVIEVAQRNTVDRDDWIFDLQLLLKVQPDDAANIAV